MVTSLVKPLVTTLVAVTLCVVAIACGASKSRQAASPATSAESRTAGGPPVAAGSPTQMPGGNDARGEIERLSAEVEQRRGELGLTEPQIADLPGPATPMASVPLSTDASCQPAKTERCTSSCKISDSICSNASRICELAQQLAGDGWAASKCARAKKTCGSAHESCCGCQ